MSHINIVEESRKWSAERVEQHRIDTERENSRWAQLEFTRRQTSRNVTRLFAELERTSNAELKELYSHVLLVAGFHVAELERQKDNVPAPDARYFREMAKHKATAAFWLRELPNMYPRSNEVADIMTALLRSAHDFFDVASLQNAK